MNYQRKSNIKHELSEIYHELSLIAIFEKLTLSKSPIRRSQSSISCPIHGNSCKKNEKTLNLYRDLEQHASIFAS